METLVEELPWPRSVDLVGGKRSAPGASDRYPQGAHPPFTEPPCCAMPVRALDVRSSGRLRRGLRPGRALPTRSAPHARADPLGRGRGRDGPCGGSVKRRAPRRRPDRGRRAVLRCGRNEKVAGIPGTIRERGPRGGLHGRARGTHAVAGDAASIRCDRLSARLELATSAHTSRGEAAQDTPWTTRPARGNGRTASSPTPPFRIAGAIGWRHTTGSRPAWLAATRIRVGLVPRWAVRVDGAPRVERDLADASSRSTTRTRLSGAAGTRQGEPSAEGPSPRSTVTLREFPSNRPAAGRTGSARNGLSGPAGA